MFNPIAWYLDKIASWGLLQTDWREGVMTAPLFFGTLGGIVCGIFGLFCVISFFCESDISHKFDDDLLMLIGYRMTATIMTPTFIALIAILGFGLATTVAGVICLSPLLALGIVVVLGPLLMLVGAIRRRGLRLNLRRKQKTTAQVVTASAAIEPFELGNDFHEIDYEGEKIIMPN